MKPLEQKLLDLLSNNDVTFYIPPYQRNYEWENEQCKVFLEDIKKTTIENKENHRAEHFFGTVTFYKSKTFFGEPDKLILIDGQQRITTTMLFLVALRDIIEDAGIKEKITQRFLKNERVSDDSEFKIKLKQVESDWETYRKIILSSKELSNKDKATAVYRNYKFFYDELNKRSDLKPFEFIELGLSKFSIITIELEPERNYWESPQEIFESMNSLGKPLSLADLIRNYLLLGLSVEEQEKLYHNCWLKIEDLLSENISNFIRDYMQCKVAKSFPYAKEAHYKELYASFKRYINGKKEDILNELVEYASIYKNIIKPEESSFKSEIGMLLKDINKFGAKVTYSFIMGLLKKWQDNIFSDVEIIELLNVLYVYIWRRRLLDLHSGENKKIPLWNREISRIINSIDRQCEFYEILSKQEASMRMPNDIELRKHLEVSNFHDDGERLKFLFALIEEKLSKLRPDLSDRNIRIECIMPEKLTEKWERDLGENYKEIQEDKLYSIGNLTLIDCSQDLGDVDFSNKKEILKTCSMKISQEQIINNEQWNKDCIEKRANWIINFILNEILPIPKEIFDSNFAFARSGWQNKTSFAKARLIGKQINYIDDKNIIVTVVSDKEVEFEGKIWKLSPLTREIKKRRGECNDSGTYQGSKFWEYNGISVWDLCLK
ncbi:MAG: DUF262 domain-containing HNH endonuclease family protein [Spirochaetota bacterium]|nr:DUF262 domain-containing HNH endonuclease family protein [Spirochaetota bacterium]